MAACSCIRAQISSAMAKAVRVDGMFYYDAQGNLLFLFDSKGFRSQLPGECYGCYLKWRLGYIQAGMAAQ